jgi:hypothetical protein
MTNAELDALDSQLRVAALFYGLQRPERADKTMQGKAAAAITKLRSENKRLRAALQKYGRHIDVGNFVESCAKVLAESNRARCTCGLDAALAGKENNE